MSGDIMSEEEEWGTNTILIKYYSEERMTLPQKI